MHNERAAPSPVPIAIGIKNLRHWVRGCVGNLKMEIRNSYIYTAPATWRNLNPAQGAALERYLPLSFDENYY